MKHPILFLALFLLPACYGDDDTRAAERNAPVSTTPGTTDDWATLESYEFDRRSDFEREMDRRIAELDRDFDRLKTSAGDRLDSGLETTRNELREAMTELKSASAETWRKSRDAVLTTARKFRDALRAPR